jgi:UrcA family protein
MKIHTRSALVVVAGLLASSLSLAAPLATQPQIIETTYTARFVRSDLATPAGAKQAYSTLRSLARRACTDDSNRSIATFAEEQKCFDKAVGSAVKDLGVSSIEQLHAGEIN